MAEVDKLAGKSFDPAVVALLKKRYVELEQKATSQNKPMARLSTDVKIERGDAPDAGFEVSNTDTAKSGKEYEFLESIGAARQEAQLLFEFSQDLGTSLSLDETLSVVATRLKRLVPYDAIAVYVCKDGKLNPEYVTGESFRFLSSLQIPIGQGLSGWVAHTGRTVLNGNPAVESGYLDDPTKFTTLRSAVAVPLVGLNGTMGVLTLYQTDRDAFRADHVRVLQAVSPKVTLAMDNAMKFRQAETSATTDFLTDLPNARSLFLRLDSELSRCKRTNEPLTVLVCDLDGFKQVNDVYGHLMGNKVLRAVGGALRESCREYDYVARMGGDEFVLVLPASDCESMQRRISQLRDIGARAGCEATGLDVMTMSIGDAYFPADGSDAEQLLAEADRRMYVAKQGAKLKRLNSAPVEMVGVATIQ
jgi:diguanylate cyclase (GGDEF)-like protein